MTELTLDLAGQEAARCLLCYDPPCTQACPADIDPAGIIRSLRFNNFKGASEKLRGNNPSMVSCTELCSDGKNCEKACIRGRVDRPVKIEYLNWLVLNSESENVGGVVND